MKGSSSLLYNPIKIKYLFPKGTEIELISINDRLATLKPGNKGVVLFVDDLGQIHVKWHSGLLLALIPGVDSFRIL